MDGSFGHASLVMKLSANGALTAPASSRLYCRLEGRWGTSDGDFIARGRDCDGTIVTFVASVASERITGTWSASSGNSGTFSLASRR